MRIVLIERAKVVSGLVLAALILAAPGCLGPKVTHVPNPGQSTPARDASLAELVTKINSWSDAIQTMTATIDLEPTAGSVYSGVIKEYHDVKGFILLKKPSTLRMLGQAPVVRTTIFDMVSDADQFRLYIPPKGKFIVGKTTFQHPAKNALENLRPQHILQALSVPPIDEEHERAYREKLDRESQLKRYFVVSIIEPQADRRVILAQDVV